MAKKHEVTGMPSEHGKSIGRLTLAAHENARHHRQLASLRRVQT